MTTFQQPRRSQEFFYVYPPIKWREIIQLFTSTDKSRGNSKFVLDRDDDATFAASVELGDNNTSQSNGSLEFSRLAERVATSRCINDQQRFMRCVRVMLGESAFYLFKLGHQIPFRVHAAGRIAQ